MSNLAAARPGDDDPPAQRPPTQRPRAQRPPPSRPPRAPINFPQARARRAGVVLIVDDQADARDVYAAYLSHSGFTTHTAADGFSAIAMAVQVKPDVIVMDLTMPRIDGVTATQRIREFPTMRDVPVILLTGYPYNAIERGAIEAGIDLFLIKPCLPEELEGHIRRLIESKRSA